MSEPTTELGGRLEELIAAAYREGLEANPSSSSRRRFPGTALLLALLTLSICGALVAGSLYGFVLLLERVF